MDDSTNDEKGGPKSANKFVRESRKTFRKKLTPTEARVWNYLRANRFHGYHFRRQHRIDKYFVDFYCMKAKLAIELDGPIHNDLKRRARDLEKTRRLEEMGIKVMRFKNPRIYFEWDKVAALILAELRKRCPNP